MNSVFRSIAIALGLLTAASCQAAQDGGKKAPSVSAENPPYPSLDYPRIKQFADAMGLRGQVARSTDSFWLPGAAILREQNPGREREVDTFVARLRERRDGFYVATALFSIDKRLSDMLVPDIAAARAQAVARSAEIYRRTRVADGPEQRQLAETVQGKIAAARPLIDRQLASLADSTVSAAPAQAWLAGLPDGNFRCLPAFRQKVSNQAFADQLNVEHCRRVWNPSYDAWVKTGDGRQFAELSGALYVAAMAAMAMSFDAGLRLDSFLPRQEVEAAGLNYPSAPIGSDELTRRYEGMRKP